jgi:hypothetical protein
MSLVVTGPGEPVDVLFTDRILTVHDGFCDRRDWMQSDQYVHNLRALGCIEELDQRYALMG